MLSFSAVTICVVALIATTYISDVSAGIPHARDASGELELRDLTNAQRLARGLPLKKPNLNRRGGDKPGPSPTWTPEPPPLSHLSRPTPPPPPFSQTPAWENTRFDTPTPAPEPTPIFGKRSACAPRPGFIKVASSCGALKGYLGNAGPKGLYTYTTDVSNAAKVLFDLCDDQPSDVAIDQALAKRSAFYLLGGIEDPRGTCTWVGGVPQTSPHAVSRDLPNTLTDALRVFASGVQSSIWKVTEGTLEASWKTSSVDASSSGTTTISYIPEIGGFTLVNGANGEATRCVGTNVTFSFVPL